MGRKTCSIRSHPLVGLSSIASPPFKFFLFLIFWKQIYHFHLMSFWGHLNSISGHFRSLWGHAHYSLKFFVFCVSVWWWWYSIGWKHFFSLVYRCNVENDIFSSLAFSDCFNFWLIHLISINLAFLSNLYCLITKSALRSPAFVICSNEKVLFI